MTDAQLLAAAKAAHHVWVEHKRSQGCHGPGEPCTHRKNPHLQHAAQFCEDGKIRCQWFFPCMTEWENMTPFFQEYNLKIAKAVLQAAEAPLDHAPSYDMWP